MRERGTSVCSRSDFQSKLVVCTCVYESEYVCMGRVVCVHVCVCMYVCMHVCVCACMCVCMCVYSRLLIE